MINNLNEFPTRTHIFNRLSITETTVLNAELKVINYF